MLMPRDDQTVANVAAGRTTCQSDDFDVHGVGVSGQGFEVGSIAGQDGASGFGERNEQSVDCRAGPSPAT